MARFVKRNKVSSRALKIPVEPITSRLYDRVSYRRRGIIDSGLDHTSWRFYNKTLSDNSATYTFTHTNATISRTAVGADGYLFGYFFDQARYEHPAGGGACLGLLHEDEQDNEFTYSDLSADTGWSVINNNRSHPVTPLGAASAETTRMEMTTTGAYAQLYHGVTLVASKYYCMSVYAQAGDLTTVRVRGKRQDNTECYVEIQGLDGTPSLRAESNAESYGWEKGPGDTWRVWVVFQNNAAGGSGVNQLFTMPSRTGEGTSGQYGYLSCAQFEEVPYADSTPTSWIPTDGSSETRYKDDTAISSFSGDTYTVEDGVTAYLDFTPYDGTSTTQVVFLDVDDGTREFLCYNANAGAWKNAIPADAGSGYFDTTNDPSYNARIKWAISWKHAEQLAAWDGASALSRTDSKTVDWEPDSIDLGYSGAGSEAYRVIYRELRLYAKTHTAAELAALTS